MTSLTIVIGGKSHQIAYVDGDTVLHAARRVALNPPSSCEAGNCATCLALLREGSATMRTNDALDDDEVAAGWILTCQAVPVGDVVVDYEGF